ncbi:hypothetical protein [Celeribacter halophilus]|uniref:hypothetical protein n=1 Tax=Celeribacter halophilus TaxID=576117 RepID=UPI003A917DFE
MKIRIALIAAALLAAGAPASAGRVKDGYVGCVTKKALDEFVSAAVNGDQRQMQALLGVSCVQIGGREFSMVDRGFVVSEIRVYFGSDSVVLFTPAEGAR